MTYQKQILNILTLSLFIVALGACTKKREPKFAQGQGTDLLLISDYNNKEFSLQTGSKIKNDHFTKSSNPDVENGKYLTIFPLVNYTTEAQLLKDVPFRGRENSDKYKVLYKMNKNHLIVYKVAKKEDLPIHEISIAEPYQNDFLMVPMIGYELENLSSVDYQKTATGEKTSTLIEMKQNDLTKATHFRIDYSSGVTFKAVQKIDVLPENYIDGEWYYSSTLIGASDKESTYVGLNSAYDTSFKDSTRIKFQKLENSILGLNSNVDERILSKDGEKNTDKNLTDDGLNSNNTLIIPIQRKAYKVEKKSGSTTLSEEVDDSVPWEQRPYMEFDFANISTVGLEVSGSNSLSDLKISDNYFSFIVFDPMKKNKTRYSFLRYKKSNYVPRPYNQKDSKVFGFFTSQRDKLKTIDVYSLDDLWSNVTLNRFNPEKEIIYHFSKTSPQWARKYAIEMVEEWNKAFISIGSKVRVKVDSSKDVDLGDIRFNIINLVETLTSNGLLGVGPSITDPITGEIISATTNIQLTSVIDSVIRDLRFYLNKKAGLYTSYWFLSQGIPGLDILANNLPDEKLGPEMVRYDRDVPKLCPQLIDYAKKVYRRPIRNTKDDLEFIKPCAIKLSEPSLKAVLLHELGHNFGLRHNFRGSTDSVNYFSKEYTKTNYQFKTSSSMDYMEGADDALLTPGTYDIAALRYGYMNQVQLKEEESNKVPKLVKIDVNKSLEDQGLSDKMRSFQYCTDEDSGRMSSNGLDGYSKKIDPLCNLEDSGSNAKEVTQSYLNFYNRMILSHHIRANKFLASGFSEENLSEKIHEIAFKPAELIYFKWRTILAEYLGHENRLLESFDKDQYLAILEKMSKDPVYGPLYAEYKPAADLLFNFLTKFIQIPFKYCAVTLPNNENQQEIIDFEKLRFEIYRSTGKTITMCSDKAAIDYLATQNRKFIIGGGLLKNRISFNIKNENDLTKAADYFSLRNDKSILLGSLMSVSPVSFLRTEKQYTFSLLNEPQYREKVVGFVLDTILNGIPWANYGLKTGGYNKTFENLDFKTGENGWKNLYRLAPNSFLPDPVAGGNGVNPQKSQFSVSRITSSSDILYPGDIFAEFEGTKFRARKEHTVGVKIVNKMNELISLLGKSETEVQKAGYPDKSAAKRHLKTLMEIASEE